LIPATPAPCCASSLAASALGGEFSFATAHRDSLGKRPNAHLLDALRRWGVAIESGPEGRLPIATRCDDEALLASPNETGVEGSVSSQFLSALLMVAPLRAMRLGRAQTIRVEREELRSSPAVETTLEVMAERGVSVEADDAFRTFRVPPSNYAGSDFRVNGDWPGSAALLCAAAVVPGSVIEIDGLRDDSQGERRVVDVLRSAGCDIAWRGGTLRLVAPPRLRAFEFDADLATDAAPVLTAVAALCEGESHFSGTANLRMKECDRVAAPLEELRKLGVESDEGIDDYSVVGCPDGFAGGTSQDGLTLNGWADHRVIMMATILGLRCRSPIVVETASHVAKSYPRFFEAMGRLGVGVEEG
jgi:3-phosphoshikimate 1-carboxyvinyltransferase